MRLKWFLLGCVITAGLVFLGIIAVAGVTTLLGDRPLITGTGVGLVEVKGMILDPQGTVKQLRDFAKADNVKAVVLRIDSPGGVDGPRIIAQDFRPGSLPRGDHRDQSGLKLRPPFVIRRTSLPSASIS